MMEYPEAVLVVSFVVLWLAPRMGAIFARRLRGPEEVVGDNHGTILAATLTRLRCVQYKEPRHAAAGSADRFIRLVLSHRGYRQPTLRRHSRVCAESGEPCRIAAGAVTGAVPVPRMKPDRKDSAMRIRFITAMSIALVALLAGCAGLPPLTTGQSTLRCRPRPRARSVAPCSPRAATSRPDRRRADRRRPGRVRDARRWRARPRARSTSRPSSGTPIPPARCCSKR